MFNSPTLQKQLERVGAALGRGFLIGFISAQGLSSGGDVQIVKKAVWAGIAAVGVTIMSYLNPKDQRFGVNATKSGHSDTDK